VIAVEAPLEVPELQVPDVIGEIVGYRAWKVQWLGRVPALFSVVHGDPETGLWPPTRWMQAVCGRGHGHEPPDIPVEGCGCGLYAAKDMRQLIEMNYGRHHVGGDETVIGEVGFAGKVIEGSQGWRAAKGRIVRLWVPLHKYEWATPLEATYRVPVGAADWRQIGLS